MASLFGFGLVVGICLLCTIPCNALVVKNTSDLIDLFKSGTGTTVNEDIEMAADLDFSGVGLSVPLGLLSDGTCVGYGGVFHGNGHRISGIVMNNTQNGGYKNAGLFCNLNGSTIENLLIDSCSFTGYSVGALSVRVTGSLTVKNVTHNGNVSGNEKVGGLIGMIEKIKERTSITFDDCLNEGNVTGSRIVGGFVGYVFNNTNITMTISNTINNGIVTADRGDYGGFVGYVSRNTNMTMTISNSINNGNTNENGYFVGGIVGTFFSNPNMVMTISNSTNNGNIVNSYNTVGGLIGYVSHLSVGGMTLTVSNSTNNGNITGTYQIGGLIGYVTTSQTNGVSLFVINTVNKGTVSATKDDACGFVSVRTNNVETTFLNSINKGDVNGKYAYGITNIATKARNVVSMGNVNGSSGSYTFWKSSNEADLFYGLKDKCKNCGNNAILFEFNNNTEFYEEVESGGRVDELLNEEGKKENYGMVWTTQLDIVHEVLFVEVSGLFDKLLMTGIGMKLNEVGNLSLYLDKEDIVVVSSDTEVRVVYDNTQIVTRNMSVIVWRGVEVTIGSPVNEKKKVKEGDTLFQISGMFGFLMDDFVVISKDTGDVLDRSSLIDKDTVLGLYHNVSVSGVISGTYVVEDGHELGTMKELEGFWNNNFTLFNGTKNGDALTRTTPIVKNTLITISKNTRVIVDMKPTDAFDTRDVVETLVGHGVVESGEVVFVETVLDGKGRVEKIVVTLRNEDVGNRVADWINGIETGDGCGYGALCKRVRAYMENDGLSSGCVHFISIISLVLSFILLSSF